MHGRKNDMEGNDILDLQPRLLEKTAFSFMSELNPIWKQCFLQLIPFHAIDSSMSKNNDIIHCIVTGPAPSYQDSSFIL